MPYLGGPGGRTFAWGKKKKVSGNSPWKVANRAEPSALLRWKGKRKIHNEKGTVIGRESGSGGSQKETEKKKSGRENSSRHAGTLEYF